MYRLTTRATAISARTPPRSRPLGPHRMQRSITILAALGAAAAQTTYQVTDTNWCVQSRAAG